MLVEEHRFGFTADMVTPNDFERVVALRSNSHRRPALIIAGAFNRAVLSSDKKPIETN